MRGHLLGDLQPAAAKDCAARAGAASVSFQCPTLSSMLNSETYTRALAVLVLRGNDYICQATVAPISRPDWRRHAPGRSGFLDKFVTVRGDRSSAFPRDWSQPTEDST